MKEGNELTNQDILLAAQLWMEGNWYHQIADALNTEVYKVIRLINGLIGYNETIGNGPIKNINSEEQGLDPFTRIISSFSKNFNHYTFTIEVHPFQIHR